MSASACLLPAGSRATRHKALGVPYRVSGTAEEGSGIAFLY